MRRVSQAPTNRIDTVRYGVTGAMAYLLLAPLAVAQVRIDTIALTGWEAPGVGPGATFSSRIDANWNDGFYEYPGPYINNSGQVLFGGQAYQLSLGDDYDDGLWVSNRDGTLRLVRQERMAAPGTDSDFGVCNDFGQDGYCTRQHPNDSVEILGLSDAGEAVFSSGLVGPEIRNGDGVANFAGIWTERGDDGLRLVARMGDPTPGIDDTFGRLRTSRQRATNAVGLVTFRAELGSDDTQSGLWVEDVNGALRLIAKSGDLAPGVGLPFTGLGEGYVDRQGDVAFAGSWIDSEDHGRNGIWRSTADGFSPIVLSGDRIPGLDGDRVFDGVSPLSMAENGNLAFTGNLAPLPADPFDSVRGLFAHSENGIRKVVLNNEVIPGYPGITYRPSDSVIDDQGRVAFTSEINSPLNNSNALFAERDGQLQLIAGPEHLPGMSEEEFVGRIFNISTNNPGHIAFSADVAVSGIGYAGEGLWVAQANGDLTKIIRTGDLLEVTPGDMREVYTLRSLDGPLNEQGQFAFVVQFLDGTQGVFRAQLVPEPGAATLALLGLLPLLIVLLRRCPRSVPYVVLMSGFVCASSAQAAKPDNPGGGNGGGGDGGGSTEFELIDLQPSGASGSNAYAISNTGLVVGEVDYVAGVWDATVAKPTFSPLPGSAIEAYSVNQHGEIVGYGPNGPTYWASASTQPIVLPMPPGYIGGGAKGISSDGVVVGSVHNESGIAAAVAWRVTDNSTFGPVVLSISGGATDVATIDTGVNRVVGRARDPQGTPAWHAMAWDLNLAQDGSFSVLGSTTLIPDNSEANAITDQGDISGVDYGVENNTGAFESQAFVIRSGALEYLPSGGNNLYGEANDLNDSDVVGGVGRFTQAHDATMWNARGKADNLMRAYFDDSWDRAIVRGINDPGNMVGWGLRGEEHSAWLLRHPPVVLATSAAIPEPSTALLTSIAMFGLAVRARRSRRRQIA